MRAKVAKRYAKALFDTALERNLVDVVYRAYKKLVEIVSATENLKYYLGEPRIPLERKRKVIRDIYDEIRKSIETEKERIAGLDLIADFSDLLLRKHRQAIIIDVMDELEILVNEYYKIVPAYVTSAIPLSEQQAQRLQETLSEVTNQNIELIQKVDESLMGGVVVRIRDHLIDGSVKGALEDMRRQLLMNVGQ